MKHRFRGERLSRRQLLARGGALAAAGAASLAAPGAGATGGSHHGQFHGGLGLDHGGNLVVGDVDLSVFDPTAYLTNFDYGKVSTLPDGRTLREYKLVASDKEIEVAPGVNFAAWTYNDQVPGPTLRCTEGDRLRIEFINGGSHPHTIHFHGIHSAAMDGVPGQGAGLVAPGDRTVYEFDALPFGCHLYHCHTPPVKRHIHKGLYGAFIVHP